MRPRPVVGEATVPDAVRRLLDKFDYPDRESPAQVIPIIPTLGGGGGALTVVVAAANATDLSKSKADFQCTGVNDETTIQAAINTIAAQTAGTVLLSEGTFNCVWGSGVIIDIIDDGLNLIGMGIDATTISLTGTKAGVNEVAIDSDSSGGIVGWMTIQDNSADTTATQAIAIASSYQKIISVSGYTRGFFINVGSGVFAGEIKSCDLDGTLGGGIFLSGTGLDYTDVHDCYIGAGGEVGIEVSSGTAHIHNNVIAPGGGFAGIYVVSALPILIADNYIDGAIQGDGEEGIWLDGALRATVKDNLIYKPERHGIRMLDSAECIIDGNAISEPGTVADNTYDGIFLEGDSDRNDLWNNKIIGASGAPQPRYGINISAATCDDNSYLGNRTGLGADYGTGAYNDAGTGTVNTWPGAAAPQGDNLL